MNRLLFKVLILILILPLHVSGQWSVLEEEAGSNKAAWYLVQKFTPADWNASNFAAPKDLEWFRDARYGMFIHFGLSTYVGKDLSWGVCHTRKAPDQGHGPYPDSVWTRWPEYFGLPDFNAAEWVKTARQAGMKYIVTIAKHHDGFHLWDTKYSDFKVTNTPFGRDYLKEIADACHAAGMKFGIYYSQRDWYHPDYAPVDTSLIEVINDPPYFKAKSVRIVKPGPQHKKYIDYQFNVVRELCTNYGKIDVFWFDACWWGGMFTADMWESERLTRMVRELQPGIIINNRASIPGDFDTPEQKIGMYQAPRPWESCISLCESWSYSPTPVKSVREIIGLLTSTVCGNGNLLLSWGPKWNGAFDSLQTERLLEVGKWLGQYGYTVFGTQGGPWYPEKWGGSTRKGNTAYIHVTSGKTDTINLPSLQNKLTGFRSLTGEKIRVSEDHHGITLVIGSGGYSPDRIIELTFEQDIGGMVSGNEFPTAQWRGPNRDGVYPDTGLLKQWPDNGPPIRFSVNALGKGFSSAVATKNWICTTGTIDTLEYLTALDHL